MESRRLRGLPSESREKDLGGSTPKSQRMAKHASSFPELDPNLSQYPYEGESSNVQIPGRSSASGFTSVFPINPPDEIKYIINIIKDGHRIKPKFNLTPNTCPGFSSLVQHIQNIMDDGKGTRSIQILSPNGMVDIVDQSTWDSAIESIKGIEWLDGEIKCVVEMED